MTAIATSLELVASPSALSVGPVRRRVAEVAVEAGAPRAVVAEIALCVSEAVTNAVLHAGGAAPALIGIVVTMSDDELTVVVRDEGRGFGASTPPNGRSPGHGLAIIEQLAGSRTIASAPNGGTEVRMTFGLDRAPHGHRGLAATGI
jgi:anti-sigma regulatory factor (Ser/Thr protein kinase)